MPMEEAYALGKMLCEMFNFPVEKLEKWHALETGPGSHQISFPFGILNSEPHVDFTIKSSINELYPWMIILNGAWGLFPDRDATQTRLPFLQPLQLSLDPPSGRRYDRADAWRDVLEAHAADPGFDERWAAQYPEEAKRLRDLRNPPPKIPPAAPAAVLSKPETAPSGHLLWWVCLLLVTALFGWYVRGVWKKGGR